MRKTLNLLLVVLLFILTFLIGWDVAGVMWGRRSQTISVGRHPRNPAKVTAKVTSPVREVPPTKSLPASVMNHLASFSTRVKQGAPVFSVQRASVLVIDPAEQYAITQFRQVWARIQPIEVVWTNTQTYALHEWKREGYASDPLPSAQTVYRAIPLFTPVAYHKIGGAWEMLGGILRPNQVQDWVKFFG